MVKRLLVLCGLAALFAVPPALAAPSGASITLNQSAPVPAGSTVTFSYTLPNTAPSPRIVLYCNDSTGRGVWGQGQWVADGTSFLVPAGLGIASCTAELGTFRNSFKEIAQTTFAVTP